MEARGSRPERLTRFNDATSGDYFGPVMTGTATWSRDGRQLLVPLVPVGGGAGGGLYLIDLESRVAIRPTGG